MFTKQNVQIAYCKHKIKAYLIKRCFKIIPYRKYKTKFDVINIKEKLHQLEYADKVLTYFANI